MNFVFGVYYLAFGVIFWQLAAAVRALPARRDPRLSLQGSFHAERDQPVCVFGHDGVIPVTRTETTPVV